MESFNTPRYLGPIPHPSIGIRMPDISLEGILSAYKMRNTAGGLMLSYGRETAPEYVINAPPRKYDITLGHTGVSIKEYITKSVKAVKKRNVLVEIEADHLIIGSSIQAVQRILGEGKRSEIDEEELARSISYNKSAIDEGISTGYVNSFTIDATNLLNVDVDEYSNEEIYEKYQKEIKNGTELLKNYCAKKFTFSSLNGRIYHVGFTENEVMKMALTFNKNLEITYIIYSYINSKMNGEPFGFEIALDELPRSTGKELIYYLQEWRSLGAHADFVAPYVGFKKRSNFDGDLGQLEEQLSFLAAIANSFGTVLSMHSGSGLTPYSGKGEDVYKTILRATNGRIKYKISGVYFELLIDLLAVSKKKRHRDLYEKIFENVENYVESEIVKNTPFASEGLRRKFSDYKNGVKLELIKRHDNRSEFFRHYSFITLNLRDDSEKRYLKEELIRLYQEDIEFRRLVDQETKELTLRLIDGLGFSNNIS